MFLKVIQSDILLTNPTLTNLYNEKCMIIHIYSSGAYVIKIICMYILIVKLNDK